MRCQRFGLYLSLLKRLPAHMINHDLMTHDLTAYMEENKAEKLHDDPDVLDICWRLYMLDLKFDAAFQILVKKKDHQVFGFMSRHNV
jgi:hypothetical protein